MEADIETLFVHDDPEVVDLLGGLLEANGCRVQVASSLEIAIARLEEGTSHVVIAAWDRRLGQDVYRWALAEHEALRFRFVFLADEIPERLEEAAARRRVVRLGDPDALVEATRMRAAYVKRGRRTRLLVVDEDPHELAAIAEVLAAEGFDVRTADSEGAAQRVLDEAEPDLVLASDGAGHALYTWMANQQPHRLANLVLVTGGDPARLRPRVEPVPVVPKGQDLPPLLSLLRRTLSGTAGR